MDTVNPPANSIPVPKINIRTMAREDLAQWLEQYNEPHFRAKQIFEWLWIKGADHFDMMTNLPQSLRARLEESFVFHIAEVDIVQKSQDGTIKVGFTLHDGRTVEGVIIPTSKRITACISSQVGCSLHCSFCATGQLKRDRNLAFPEIVDQVRGLNELALDQFGRGLTNIVFMGMGEPLLNLEEVFRATEILTAEEAMNMASRRITLSTVGIARGIRKLAKRGSKFNLAWSLHAATNAKRAQIMDINKSNPIEEVVDSIKEFYAHTKRKVTLEYILFQKFNDSEEDARNLIKIAKEFPCFINLIEYNSVKGVSLERSTPTRSRRFLEILTDNGLEAHIRRSRGHDIDAACGQLAGKKQ